MVRTAILCDAGVRPALPRAHPEDPMLTALLLTACLAPNEGTPETPVPTTPPTPAEAEVGPDGGSFTLAGGVQVEAPAQAVTEPFTLNLELLDVPEPYVGRSALFRFGPAGTALDAPLVVTLPYDAAAATDPRVYLGSEADGYRLGDAVLVDGLATVELSVLEDVFVAEPLPLEDVHPIAPMPFDLLVVVDDSASMADNQQTLASAAGALLQPLLDAGADFHVGVTTTDTNNTVNRGRLRRATVDGTQYRFIDPSTPTPIAAYSAMVQAGTAGWYDETGREAAYLLLETQRNLPRNADFQRDEANLHVLFVSDENDYSVQPTRQEFRNWSRHLKPLGYDVTMHAITGLPTQLCSAVWETGQEYITYTNWNGGVQGSICDANWAPIMTQLTEAMLVGPTVFPLQATPAVGSVEIDLLPDDGGDPIPLYDDEFEVFDAAAEDEGADPAPHVRLLVPSPLNGEVVIRYTPA